jgi:hypothetical protein
MCIFSILRNCNCFSYITINYIYIFSLIFLLLLDMNEISNFCTGECRESTALASLLTNHSQSSHVLSSFTLICFSKLSKFICLIIIIIIIDWFEFYPQTNQQRSTQFDPDNPPFKPRSLSHSHSFTHSLIHSFSLIFILDLTFFLIMLFNVLRLVFIENGGDSLNAGTLDLSAVHYATLEYNLHSMYGHFEAMGMCVQSQRFFKFLSLTSLSFQQIYNVRTVFSLFLFQQQIRFWKHISISVLLLFHVPHMQERDITWDTGILTLPFSSLLPFAHSHSTPISYKHQINSLEFV